MATYYSNIFSGLGATVASTKSGTTIANKVQAVTAAHARTRTTVAHLRVDDDEKFLTTDVAHMMILRPTDRLLSLHLCTTDQTASGTLNIGTYSVTKANGVFTFTVDDIDLFTSAVDLVAATLSWTEVMLESGTVTRNYIGKPMWEIANLGAGTWTANMTDLFAISITPAADTDVDNTDIVLIATYVSGD